MIRETISNLKNKIQPSSQTQQTTVRKTEQEKKGIFKSILSPPKKKRGRPRKAVNLSKLFKPKRKRGRPRKRKIPVSNLLSGTSSTRVRRDIEGMKSSVDVLIGMKGGDPFAPATEYGARLDQLIGSSKQLNPFEENLSQRIDLAIAGGNVRSRGTDYAYRIDALISGGYNEWESGEEYKRRLDKNLIE